MKKICLVKDSMASAWIMFNVVGELELYRVYL